MRAVAALLTQQRRATHCATRSSCRLCDTLRNRLCDALRKPVVRCIAQHTPQHREGHAEDRQ